MTSILTPEQIKEARDLRRSEGMAWHRIAERLGVNAETIQRQIDSEYVVRTKERRCRSVNGLPRIEQRSGRPTEAEFLIARNLIPPDDRDLTAVLMGDPVSQRSALYRRQANVR